MVRLKNNMQLKEACIILFSCCIILCIALLLLTRKHYLEYNLLKLDPLGNGSSGNNLRVNSSRESGIWLVGDSRIARWEKDMFPGLSDNKENLGIEGQTTSQCFNRLKSNFDIATPDWLFLEIGINDLKIIGMDKSLTAYIIENCYNNVRSIIELCKKNGVNVVVINIFPTGDVEMLRRFVWDSAVDLAIIETNEKLRSYCVINKVHYFDAYSILTDGEGLVKKNYQKDFLHVNQEAYSDLSKSLVKQFKDIIDFKIN